jgi:hypothetical protein
MDSGGVASTAASARVALAGHRLRVQQLVSDYLAAILSADGARAAELVFVDRTVTADANEPYWSVAELIEHHRAATGRMDLAHLRWQLEQPARAPIIRAAAEARRGNPSAVMAASPGDWVVDLPFVMGAPVNSVARYLPFRWVVRFIAGTPRVVGISPVVPVRM